MAVPEAAAPTALLYALADSRLPVGGHVHSGGMEEAVTSGLVRDVASVRALLVRRLRTSGLVAASIVARRVAGELSAADADAVADARTPGTASRAASRAQGRGMVRLGRRLWPGGWDDVPARPHAATAFGELALRACAAPRDAAAVHLYTTLTCSATAAQRLLALDPADVAAVTVELTGLVDELAADACRGDRLASDPLLDLLAERHARRERPLFAS